MKVKLMTESGFSKMENVKKITPFINIPMRRKILEATSPEMEGLMIGIFFTAKFQLFKKYKNYALYKQVDVLVDLDKQND